MAFDYIYIFIPLLIVVILFLIKKTFTFLLDEASFSNGVIIDTNSSRSKFFSAPIPGKTINYENPICINSISDNISDDDSAQINSIRLDYKLSDKAKSCIVFSWRFARISEVHRIISSPTISDAINQIRLKFGVHSRTINFSEENINEIFQFPMLSSTHNVEMETSISQPDDKMNDYPLVLFARAQYFDNEIPENLIIYIIHVKRKEDHVNSHVLYTYMKTFDNQTLQLKEIFDSSSENIRNCVVCFEQKSTILFLPCRHNCICFGCYQNYIQDNYLCPICRLHVNGTIFVNF